MTEIGTVTAAATGIPEASIAALERTPTAANGTVSSTVRPDDGHQDRAVRPHSAVCEEPAVRQRSAVRQHPPRRQPNRAKRAREYLTPAEVEQLMQAARARGRYGARDAAMILVAYRHGLRVAELVGLRWDQVNLGEGLLHVQRVKRGTPSVHPLRGLELRLLRALRREQAGGYVFMTKRGAPMTAAGFRKMLARAGCAAGLDLAVHPHMLRHACGFKLANDGHDTRAIQHYLGHRNITHTVRYTELSPERFREFWND